MVNASPWLKYRPELTGPSKDIGEPLNLKRISKERHYCVLRAYHNYQEVYQQ